MSAVDDFASALARESAADPDPASLPTRLARAAVRALPVQGAGITLAQDEPVGRLPVGASDPTAALAERLQFTAGDGPCLTSSRLGQPVFSDEEDAGKRWPAFVDALVTRTPYRAVASLPLFDRGEPFASLDLYLDDPSGLRALDVFDVVSLASLVADALVTQVGLAAAFGGGDRSPGVSDRLSVWQVIGLLATRGDTDSDTALSRLRAYAFGRDETVDDVAAAVSAGRLDPERVLQGDPV